MARKPYMRSGFGESIEAVSMYRAQAALLDLCISRRTREQVCYLKHSSSRLHLHRCMYNV